MLNSFFVVYRKNHKGKAVGMPDFAELYDAILNGDEIGADGYGENPGSAITVARALRLNTIPDSGPRNQESGIRNQ